MDEENKMYICAIYDKKAETYQPDAAFFVINKVHATRMFMDACKNDKSPMFKYPEDFRLDCLGFVDVKTGKITKVETIETLLEAKNVVSK